MLIASFWKNNSHANISLFLSVSECNIGYFGWNCSETCTGCIADECNHINGICKNDSVCKTGYKYGKYCNQSKFQWFDQELINNHVQ